MEKHDEIPGRLEELVILFLQKEISEDDLNVLFDWLKQDRKFQRYFNEINMVFQISSIPKIDTKKVDNGWKKLLERI